MSYHQPLSNLYVLYGWLSILIMDQVEKHRLRSRLSYRKSSSWKQPEHKTFNQSKTFLFVTSNLSFKINCMNYDDIDLGVGEMVEQ